MKRFAKQPVSTYSADPRAYRPFVAVDPNRAYDGRVAMSMNGPGIRRPRAGRTKSFGVLGAVAVLCSGGCEKPSPSARSSTDHRLNVLLVTLDTTRADHLGCYGYPLDTSPNIDALAADGVRFDLAISQAALTPVSHASILTGLNPYQHGLRVLHAASHYRLPDNVPTLATVLHDAGWTTGAFLSAFPVSEHFGFARGFDVFDNGLREPAEDMIQLGDNGKWNWDVEVNQRRSDGTSDRLIAWIRTAPQPFFAWVHYWDPHDANILPPQDVVRRFVFPDQSKEEQAAALYDAELFYVDRQFGRVRAALRERGQYARTIIVVTADHGEGLSDGLADHGWWRHRILYQQQIRVPLIVRLPEGPRGVVVPELVRTIDVFPTVAETLGLALPAPVEGKTLTSLMRSEPEAPRIAYADALNVYDLNAWMTKHRPQDDLLFCAMDRKWKLIYRLRNPRRSELYNIEADPRELHNVYGLVTAPAKRLLSELQRFNGFVHQPFGSAAVDTETASRLKALGYISAPQEDATTNNAEDNGAIRRDAQP